MQRDPRDGSDGGDGDEASRGGQHHREPGTAAPCRCDRRRHAGLRAALGEPRELHADVVRTLQSVRRVFGQARLDQPLKPGWGQSAVSEAF